MEVEGMQPGVDISGIVSQVMGAIDGLLGAAQVHEQNIKLQHEVYLMQAKLVLASFQEILLNTRIKGLESTINNLEDEIIELKKRDCIDPDSMKALIDERCGD